MGAVLNIIESTIYGIITLLCIYITNHLSYNKRWHYAFGLLSYLNISMTGRIISYFIYGDFTGEGSVSFHWLLWLILLIILPITFPLLNILLVAVYNVKLSKILASLIIFAQAFVSFYHPENVDQAFVKTLLWFSSFISTFYIPNLISFFILVDDK